MTDEVPIPAQDPDEDPDEENERHSAGAILIVEEIQANSKTNQHESGAFMDIRVMADVKQMYRTDVKGAGPHSGPFGRMKVETLKFS